MRVLIGLALPFFIFACATKGKYEENIKSWVGYPVDGLVVQIGPPNQKYQLSNGSWIYEYSSNRTVTVSGYSYQSPETTTYTGTTNSTGHISTYDNQGNSAYGNSNRSTNHRGTATTYVTKRTPDQHFNKSCTARYVVDDGIIVNYSFQGNDCKSR